MVLQLSFRVSTMERARYNNVRILRTIPLFGLHGERLRGGGGRLVNWVGRRLIKVLGVGIVRFVLRWVRAFRLLLGINVGRHDFPWLHIQ
jgi:hypothetical protein